MNRSAAFCLAAAIFAGVVPALTLAEPPAPLAQPAATRYANAFIEAINAGTEPAIRAFEEAFAGKERRERSSTDDRVNRLKGLRDEWGALTIQKVLGASDQGVTLVVRSANSGDLAFEFETSAAEPGKLNGVTISPAAELTDAPALTAESRTQIVEGACKALQEGYVYPKVADEMAASVRGKLKAGAYDSIDTEAGLARALTKDLRAVSHDGHLALRPAPKKQAPMHGAFGDGDQIKRENYMFRKVEVLPGNIGYLRLDGFLDGAEAEKTAAAAMNFLANTDAIIFDVRYNGGGSPEMIRFLTSYLFEQKTHLNDMVDREGKVVEEYWTVESVPGQRPAANIPVYVLTSKRTFSGAEEFSYNLKNLKRATIVGETTGGGAHPVRIEPVTDRIAIGVPFMRACNPITKTNWEGTGVAPDIAVSADKALDEATAAAKIAVNEKRAGK